MKKRIPLNCGEIVLHGKNYEIKKICGMGGSCIVYDAVYLDTAGNRHKVRIKELYPFGDSCARNEDNSITGISEVSKKRFKDAFDVQICFLSEKQTVNTAAGLWEMTEANNTYYQILEYYNGSPLEFDILGNMEKYLSVMLQISDTLAEYHAAGYVHLDVKPDNIYYLPPQYDAIYTTGKILLLDFDSIVSENDIKNKTVVLSYSQDYAAPELKYNDTMQEITKKADFYSLGCMLFRAVMHRFPDALDCDMFAEWDFDLSDALFANMPQAFFEKLTDFFHKTLSSWVDDRYETDEELISALEELHILADVKKPFLESNISNTMNRYFVGRKTELQELKEKLETEKYVFIQGTGGVGKTSLSLNYASVSKNNYDTVLFAEYNGSFKEMIEDDFSFPIGNMPEDNHSAEKKFSVFREICSQSKVLLIIDNYDTEETEQLYFDFLTLPCHIIITTRMKLSDSEKNTVTLKGLAEAEELFYHYCSRTFSEEEKKCLVTVFDEIDRHAMTVELLAKLFRDTDISPKEAYQKIHKANISTLPKDSVKNFKDNVFSSHSVDTHIDVLFSLSGFTEEEILTLQIVSLLIDKALYKPRLFAWFPDISEISLNHLIRRGWIQENSEFQLLFVHSLIFDRLMLHFPPQAENCEPLISYMLDNSHVPYKTCTKIEQRICGETDKLSELWLKLGKKSIDSDKEQSRRYLEKAKNFLKSHQKTVPYIIDVLLAYNNCKITISTKDYPIKEYKNLIWNIKEYLRSKVDYDFYDYMWLSKIIDDKIIESTMYFGKKQKCSELFKCIEKLYLAAFRYAENEQQKQRAAAKLHEFYYVSGFEEITERFSGHNPYKSIIKSEYYYRYTEESQNEPSVSFVVNGKTCTYDLSEYDKELRNLSEIMTDKHILKAASLAKSLAKKFLKDKETKSLVSPDICHLYAALEATFQYNLLIAVYKKQNNPSEQYDLARIYLKKGNFTQAINTLKKAEIYQKECISNRIYDTYRLVSVYLLMQNSYRTESEKKFVREKISSLLDRITGQKIPEKNNDTAELFLKTAKLCIKEQYLAEAEQYLTCFAAVWDPNEASTMYDYEYKFLNMYKKITNKSNLFLYYAYFLKGDIYSSKHYIDSQKFYARKNAYLKSAKYAEKLFGTEDFRTARVMDKAADACTFGDRDTIKIKKRINYQALAEYELQNETDFSNYCKIWIDCIDKYENARNQADADKIMKKIKEKINKMQATNLKNYITGLECLEYHYGNKTVSFLEHTESDLKKAVEYGLKIWNLRDEAEMSAYSQCCLCQKINEHYENMQELSQSQNFMEERKIWLTRALKFAESEDNIHSLLDIYNKLSKLDIPEKEYYRNKYIQLKQQHMS